MKNRFRKVIRHCVQTVHYDKVIPANSLEYYDIYNGCSSTSIAMRYAGVNNADHRFDKGGRCRK